MKFQIAKMNIETTSPNIFLEDEKVVIEHLESEKVDFEVIDEGLAFGGEDNFVLITSLIILIKDSVYSGIIYDLIKYKVVELYGMVSSKNKKNTFIDVEFYENGVVKRIQLANAIEGVIKIRNHRGKWVTLKNKNDE
ncbi:hypothetical protein EHQ13_16355 [Leptospira gomenensis]|uniref:Uncharacterized protein n=1 Tax=Leptospira gomenensis TaxID=2484974 RepID=A0A5F1YJC7_9LEPT|nr:hypothetical protein [Leptospira gomenensis]TGK38476.1 hypothetical protein EHQ17_02240 [Leptospira gomenensis]TGK42591.1 hypothetical protein EHQ07_14335 [Leptospira gomenensis]TGK55839.1 hypothetical protein EHQ13_16355 [Leptospira gomenensis]